MSAHHAFANECAREPNFNSGQQWTDTRIFSTVATAYQRMLVVLIDMYIFMVELRIDSTHLCILSLSGDFWAQYQWESVHVQAQCESKTDDWRQREKYHQIKCFNTSHWTFEDSYIRNPSFASNWCKMVISEMNKIEIPLPINLQIKWPLLGLQISNMKVAIKFTYLHLIHLRNSCWLGDIVGFG